MEDAGGDPNRSGDSVRSGAEGKSKSCASMQGNGKVSGRVGEECGDPDAASVVEEHENGCGEEREGESGARDWRGMYEEERRLAGECRREGAVVACGEAGGEDRSMV